MTNFFFNICYPFENTHRKVLSLRYKLSGTRPLLLTSRDKAILGELYSHVAEGGDVFMWQGWLLWLVSRLYQLASPVLPSLAQFVVGSAWSSLQKPAQWRSFATVGEKGDGVVTDIWDVVAQMGSRMGTQMGCSLCASVAVRIVRCCVLFLSLFDLCWVGRLSTCLWRFAACWVLIFSPIFPIAWFFPFLAESHATWTSYCKVERLDFSSLGSTFRH